MIVRKALPELWIDSYNDMPVYGGVTEFVLVYGNVGGLESRVWIHTTFPEEANFLESDPPPNEVGPEGEWATWDLGEFGHGMGHTITVSTEIAPRLPPSTTIQIWSGIHNHIDELADETEVIYHVPAPTWDKWVNGVPWHPDLEVPAWTSDTLTVVDVISTRSGAAIVENWNPEHLALTGYITEPVAGIILSGTGFLSWEFPMGVPETITITKFYHVEPGAWDYTVLWEELWMEAGEWERRPVHVEKIPSEFVYLPLVVRNY